MSVKIEPFAEKHVQDAEALFANAYRRQRNSTPSLPARHEDASVIAPMLGQLSLGIPGSAAIRDGKLAGYLLGMLLDPYRGQRCVYVPEWAHALDSDQDSKVFQEMYAQAARRWVAHGCFKHLITVLAQNSVSLDAVRWLGFGLMCVDAVRDLTSVRAARSDLTMRCAAAEDGKDVELITKLIEALSRYSAQSPTFLAYTDPHDQAFHREWLSSPNHALWVASRDDEALACMGFRPSNPEAAYVISDPTTISITSAFTVDPERGSGIGTTLLGRGLAWAREQGFERCAVDFEPQNLLGARFWLRHFKTVCYSLERYIDPRINWANESRKVGDVW